MDDIQIMLLLGCGCLGVLCLSAMIREALLKKERDEWRRKFERRNRKEWREK